MRIPILSAFFGALKARFSRAGHRVTYSVRDLYRDSLKEKHDQEEIQLEIGELKRDEHIAQFTDKLTAHLTQSTIRADKALKDMMKSLGRMGTDLVVIFHAMKGTLITIATEDNKIVNRFQQGSDQQKSIIGYRNKAIELQHEVDKLANKVGEAFKVQGGIPSPFGMPEEVKALASQALRRDSYPIRDIHRIAPLLLSRQKAVQKATRKFQRALEKHILNELLSEEKKIEELIPVMMKELHQISIDTIVIFHVSMKSIQELISKAESLKNVPKLSKRKYRERFVLQLQKLKDACREVGVALIGESRQEKEVAPAEAAAK